MKTFVKLAAAAFVFFILLQAIRPGIPVQPATAEVQAPPEIRRILDRDCYACHSGERRLSWFDQVVPAYWLVRHDILTARRHLDFSTLGSKPPAVQRATLFEAANMIQLGAMPLPQYVQMHPEAKVTPEDLATLKAWLAPWGPLPPPAANVPTTNPSPANLVGVPPEFNGLAFDASFEGWQLVSVTDRGDNNTFRFILGNDVAMAALASGNITPWPDGTRFAKIAWQQVQGGNELVVPGSFVQVELMVKDAARYKASEGWGWGRWRGLDLKPYGSDAGFVNECTGCHQPLRGNDYVYTLPIAASKGPDEEILNSRAAQFGQTLFPFAARPVTLFVDRRAGTISVLFNDKGTLMLVTWSERDDPHWFGARIPDRPVSLETLGATPHSATSVYRRFNGAGQSVSPPGAVAAQRTAFLKSLAPAQLP